VKVTYDTETDSLTVIFKEQVAIAESDEDKPGIILDYDKDGNLVSIEVLDAPQRVSDAKKIVFQTTGWLIWSEQRTRALSANVPGWRKSTPSGAGGRGARRRQGRRLAP
jgi:uncharacterized protein YuzE